MAYLRNLQTGEHIELLAQHILGRQAECAHTILTDPQISGLHAIISWDGRHWIVEDRSSTGTYINGVRIMKDTPFRLNKGEKLNFANLSGDTWQMLDDQYNQNQVVRVVRVAEQTHSIKIHFHVDPNEEQIVLIVEHHDGAKHKNYHFGQSEHHYLLLLLARQRIIDQIKGLAPEQQGWLAKQQLSQMLRLTAAQVYGQLYCFGQQIVNVWGINSVLPQLLEMKNGEVRFLYDNIHIHDA